MQLQTLALLEGFDLARDGPPVGRVRPHRPRVREARVRRPRGVVRRPGVRRRAARDAAEPRRTPTSAARWSARRRRSTCGRARRTAASRVLPRDARPSRSRSAAGFGVGEPTLGGRGDGPVEGDTCHVDVVDRHGNMVSATPSGGWLHASPAIPGLGLCLGTRAQMFWLEEGLPNALEPGKRPRTTLTPSLGAARRRGRHRVGHPGRRRTGPVVAAVPPVAPATSA